MRKEKPATLPWVVAPGREQSSQKVSPFSLEDLSDVVQLSESNLISNTRHVVEIYPYGCVLNLHLSHFYHDDPQDLTDVTIQENFERIQQRLSQRPALTTLE